LRLFIRQQTGCPTTGVFHKLQEQVAPPAWLDAVKAKSVANILSSPPQMSSASRAIPQFSMANQSGNPWTPADAKGID
jgi:hypothetical protein